MCNHGVPEQVIADHFEVQRRFFSLPLESKMTVLVDKATNRWVQLAAGECCHAWGAACPRRNQDLLNPFLSMQRPV